MMSFTKIKMGEVHKSELVLDLLSLGFQEELLKNLLAVQSCDLNLD